MRLEWTPTAGHSYKVYEVVSGIRKLIGQTTTGNFILQNVTKGTHHYVVRAVNAAGESRPSNDVSFVQKHR